MPEGRLIKRKITRSRRLNKLPLECRYLMREFILWGDREGRLVADPHWVNREFFCGDTDNYTDEQVKDYLQMLHDSREIELYEVDGKQYLWVPEFDGEQSKELEKPNGEIKTDDLKVATMIKAYEDEAKRTLTPHDVDILIDFADNYPDSWFERALTDYPGKPLNYLGKVMENWRVNDGERPPTLSKDTRESRVSKLRKSTDN